jgi:hypothetical protein
MSSLENPERFTIALYEKDGRAYSEIGVLFDGEVVLDEATEAFISVCNTLPPISAIDRAIEVRSAEGYEKDFGYEIRLIRGTRVLGTMLWEPEIVAECVEDYMGRSFKTYTATVEITIDEEDDPEEVDWNFLEAIGKLTVIDFVEKL